MDYKDESHLAWSQDNPTWSIRYDGRAEGPGPKFFYGPFVVKDGLKVECSPLIGQFTFKQCLLCQEVHNKIWAQFFEQLNDEILEVGGTREVIITGDLNGRTGHRIGCKIVGPFGEDVVSDKGRRIIEVCDHHVI